MEAPVEKGQKIGTLTYYLGEEIIREFSIITSEKISRITYKDVLIKLVKQFLNFEMIG